MTDLRTTLVRLLNEIHDLRLEGNNLSLRVAADDARAVLAQPAPEGPPHAAANYRGFLDSSTSRCRGRGVGGVVVGCRRASRSRRLASTADMPLPQSK